MEFTESQLKPDGLVTGGKIIIEIDTGAEDVAITVDVVDESSGRVGVTRTDSTGERRWVIHELADGGTIRLPCATIGTWTFGGGLHTEIDQTVAAAGCTNGELTSLGWSYDALLSGTPAIRRLPDGSLLIGSSMLGHIVPSVTQRGAEPPAETGTGSGGRRRFDPSLAVAMALPRRGP